MPAIVATHTMIRVLTRAGAVQFVELGQLAHDRDTQYRRVVYIGTLPPALQADLDAARAALAALPSWNMRTDGPYYHETSFKPHHIALFAAAYGPWRACNR